MQKLGSENINTPWDASQVPCNCGLWLNREETLSAASKKTFYNNPDENLQTWVCLGLKPFKLPTIQEVCAMNKHLKKLFDKFWEKNEKLMLRLSKR